MFHTFSKAAFKTIATPTTSTAMIEPNIKISSRHDAVIASASQHGLKVDCSLIPGFFMVTVLNSNNKPSGFSFPVEFNDLERLVNALDHGGTISQFLGQVEENKIKDATWCVACFCLAIAGTFIFTGVYFSNWVSLLGLPFVMFGLMCANRHFNK